MSENSKSAEEVVHGLLNKLDELGLEAEERTLWAIRAAADGRVEIKKVTDDRFFKEAFEHAFTASTGAGPAVAAAAAPAGPSTLVITTGIMKTGIMKTG